MLGMFSASCTLIQPIVRGHCKGVMQYSAQLSDTSLHTVLVKECAIIVFDMHCAALFAPGECLQHGESHCLRHALRGSVCSWRVSSAR